MPFFSLITPCLNSGSVLDRTMRSVAAQACGDYEYLVIDGASSDETPSVLEKYGTIVDRLVSEPDRGVYDAMNKGLALARGTYVYFLNAGDELLERSTLALVQDACRNHSMPDLVYGDVVTVSPDGRNRVLWRYPRLSSRFLFENALCHQGIFAKRELFDRPGPFDEEYEILADFAWLLKSLYHTGVRTHQLRAPIAVFYLGGMSSRADLSDERTRILQRYMPRQLRLLWSRAGPVAGVVRRIFWKVRKLASLASRRTSRADYENVLWL